MKPTIHMVCYRVDTLRRDVNIGLVGKYTKLEDSYASMKKALEHASISVGYNLKLTVSVYLFNISEILSFWH